MAKLILVTGSSGTVGTELLLTLQSLKYKTIPLDIKPSLWDRTVEKKTIRFDLRKKIPHKLFPRPDIIVHLAANARVHDLVLEPQKALDNYIMTHNVLEYARLNNVKNVIFSSSREVYGESAGNKKRKEPSTHVTQIKSPYTASKFAAEALIHAYHECYDVKPVIVRLSNVYGRYDVSERVIPFFIYQALRNRTINVFGASKKLDFTYIDDAVDGLVRIIKRIDRLPADTFNLSRGEGATLLKVAKTIISSLGSGSKLITSAKRVGEITTFIADLTNAKDKLNYQPKVSIDEGLENNIDWYIEAMKEKRIYNSQVRNLKKRGWA